MRMWLPCRHEEVFWIDAHTCCCHECGKTGIWYEEGLVLWCRRRRTQGMHEMFTQAVESGRGEVAAIADHPASISPSTLEPGIRVRQRTSGTSVEVTDRRASA